MAYEKQALWLSNASYGIRKDKSCEKKSKGKYSLLGIYNDKCLLGAAIVMLPYSPFANLFLDFTNLSVTYIFFQLMR